MKILHTADWHLGRQLGQYSLIEDQREILQQITTIIAEERPDACIIAGDIFDRSLPSKEAVDLFDTIMTQLIVEMKQTVIAIAGNHDSPERVALHSRILSSYNLHLLGRLSNPVQKLLLQDDAGPVAVYLVPYTEPAVFNHLYNTESVRTHQDVFTRLLAELQPDVQLQERNILVAHAFVAGGKVSDSERMLSVGLAEFIPASLFSPFTYVALGHLHAPQEMIKGKVRYSGSPMKYSVSEAGHKKSVTICEIDAQGETVIREIALKPVRDVLLVTGCIVDGKFSVTDGTTPAKNDFLQVTLTNEESVMDAMRIVQERYPNTLGLDWSKRNKGEAGGAALKISEMKEQKPIELCSNFYEAMTGKALTEEQKKTLFSVIQNIEKGENA